MANRRIFWAIQGVAMGNMGAVSVNNTAINSSYRSTTLLNPVMGLQSVGITTNFNLEQAFQLGQLALYENIEEVPDVEITMEKVIDGAPMLYHLATSTVGGAVGVNGTLVGRSNERADVRLGIWNDTAERAAGTGNTLEAEVYCSGMYLSSLSYTFPTDGNCTESITMVGNHKEWTHATDSASAWASTTDYGFVGNLAGPTAAPSGVQRRENVDVVNSTFPAEVRMSNADGGLNATPASRKVHINSISMSCDLGREEIRELGRKGPYFRYVTFPIEVTCDFEVTATSGDFIQALEEGDNLSDRQITIKLDDVTTFNLGSKNKLSSITYGGGDTGGGNSTVTFSYSTFNDFKVTNPNTDPALKTA